MKKASHSALEFLPETKQKTQEQKKKGKVSKKKRNFDEIVILLSKTPVSLRETIVTKNTASHTACQETETQIKCVFSRLDRDKGFRETQGQKYPKTKEKQKPKIKTLIKIQKEK